MRRLALGLLASSAMTVGLGQAGSAAPPAPAPMPFNWTGFYIGGHAGYRWADADLTAGPFSFTRATPNPNTLPFNIPGRSEPFNLDGGILGLHAGYNYQFAPTWLVGIEVDISWGRRSATRSFSTTDGLSTLLLTRTSALQIGSQGSVRGRFGWVNGPLLVYATGGVSFLRAEWTESWSPLIPLDGPPVPFAVSARKTLAGWTLGVGLEHMIAARWLVRAEYLYAAYEDFSVPLALTTNTGNFDITTQVLRAGVSYRLSP